MLKSALRMVVSLCVLALVAPATQAATGKHTSHRKTPPKKTVLKASSARHSTTPAIKTSLDSSGRTVKRVVTVRGKRKVIHQRVAYTPTVPVVPPVMTAGDMAGLNTTHDPLALRSNAAVVIDQGSSRILFEKNSRVALPIASLTKLMTAVVVVEAHQNMDEVLEVTADDVDREKNSSSRLRVGSRMSRANMLHIALMSSENRAASALGRNYPGGLPAFVAAMNAKAKTLGMNDTHYVDSTGLSSHNVASALDLAQLVTAAYQYPVIRDYSTDGEYVVDAGGYHLQYHTSNRLVLNSSWDIGLQKTGYISEAGRCLLMQTRIDGRPVIMVFLDSKGKDSRLADAGRVRKWLEVSKPQPVSQTVAQSS